MPEACPECGSAELARIGAGTQRLERELEERVPELERFRLDADAVTERGALVATLRRFAAADRAVLVGTQMVAKGHHFTGVSLAAVIDADTGLGVPDFRAEERTFQLVTQLAGRSGRDAPGSRARPDASSPSPARSLSLRGTTSRGSSQASSSGGRSSATRRSATSCGSLVSGPDRDDVDAGAARSWRRGWRRSRAISSGLRSSFACAGATAHSSS